MMMMPFGTDPAYLILMVGGMALTFIPQWWVQHTYKQNLEINSRYGQTGAQVATDILRHNGINDVTVELSEGFLSDHYDPSAKAVRLSPDNYHGTSIAGIAVSAHEVGHALQHAKGYYPVVLRSAMVPVVNLGSNLGPLLLMVSLGLGYTSQVMPDWAWYLAWAGVALFGAAVLFHMVTLPVEFNASARALAILENGTYITRDELPAAKKVLFAAAMTYVAAALYALIQLMYYVFRLLGARRDD